MIKQARTVIFSHSSNNFQKGQLKVLLILNRGQNHDMKVLIRLHTQELMDDVRSLMDQKREREAFDLVFAKGEVIDYIPAGRKTIIKPAYTLIEDIL